MFLSEQALNSINTPTIRVKIALALGITEQSVIMAIKKKRTILTKYAAIQVIKQETGLSEDQIFETPVNA